MSLIGLILESRKETSPFGSRPLFAAKRRRPTNKQPTKIRNVTSFTLGCALLLALVAVQATTQAATITVTGTGDTIAVDGLVTLREAITSANNNANVNADVVAVGVYGTDTINFAIAGAGVHTISPATDFPTIIDPVVIDGYTQPGASPNTLAVGDNAVILIELDGSGAASGASGLVITAGSSTVRGLVINRFNTGGFGRSGITLQTGGGNTITGNFIGTDPAGAVAQPNPIGIYIIDSPNNIVGGTTPGARNLLSANEDLSREGEQLLISGSSASGNQVQGNYVGTNAAGNGSLSTAGGRSVGITLLAPSNTIGGTVLGAGNLISGNSNDGIYVSSAQGTIIQGNLIGTDGNGTSANTNGTGGIDGVSGIQMQDCTNSIVGGTTAGSRNIISGNVGPGVEFGIFVGGSGNTIQGNFIGVDITGNGALGNAGPGIGSYGAFNNTIGGTAAGAGNIIAFNTHGVTLSNVQGAGTGNAILSNSIFSNSPGLGIDLHTGFSPDEVTPNDPADGDSGPNNLQNFPVLTSLTIASGNTTIDGSLNSAANTTFRVEFFASQTADPSGNGEGQTFLGFRNVTTDGSGNAAFSAVLPLLSPAGQAAITATATDPSNNTSEFSLVFQIASDQLLNISTRMRVLTGDNVLIGGFIITGTVPKKVIVRAIGPSLSTAMPPVPGALADPVLELHEPSGTVITNDNWKDTQEAEIIASTIPPTNDFESAIVATLDPGNYTAIVSGKNGGTGVGLVEAYDLDRAAGRLANISTRGFVDTADNVMIGGFIIGGDTAADILLRAIGPSLTDQGVPNALQDPTLELHDGNGNTLTSNDDWKETHQAEIEATGIPPTNDRESALISTLAPGSYTAIVRGKNDTTGVGLVEVYNLQ